MKGPAIWASLFLLVLVAISLALYLNTSKSSQPKPMDVQINSEEGGFVDFSLPIKTSRINGPERHLLLEGVYKGETVGLEMTVPADMKAGVALEGNSLKIINTYSAKFISAGTSSSAFLKMLGELYGVPSSGKFSDKDIPLSLLPMEEKDYNIENQPVKAKVFFEKPEKYYSELFLNFNVPLGYVQFAEKDQEYRKTILPMLQGEP